MTGGVLSTTWYRQSMLITASVDFGYGVECRQSRRTEQNRIYVYASVNLEAVVTNIIS